MLHLTVTAKGQVTLKKEVLRHLGVNPGDKIAVDLAADGKVGLKAAPEGDGIERIFGMLHKPGRPAVTIDKMKEIIAGGWTGKR